MLLSDARTRTRRFLDAVDDAGTADSRFGDGEVDAELKAAQSSIWRMVADRCSLWATETTVTTTSAGVGDLSALNPIRILNVGLSMGGITREQVQPARARDGMTNLPLVATLRISYIPRPTAPAVAGDTFTWGASAAAEFDTELLDKAVCIRAALALNVKEAEQRPRLDAEWQRIEAEILRIASIPRFSARPLRGRQGKSGIFWMLTAPDTLQLVA